MFTISSILIFLGSAALGIIVFSKGYHKKLNRIWAAFCFITLFWGMGGYKFSTTPSKESALFWWQIAYLCVIFSPVIYFHFVYVFLKLNKNYQRFILIFAYLLSFIFLFFLWYDKSRYFLGDLRWVFGEFYCIDWLKHKNILWLIFYISFYWILLLYAFTLLIKAYRKSSGLKRLQLKYFILGSLIGWLGPELVYLPAFHIDIYPYSNFLIAIYPAIFVYAIVKYRLMDIHVTITRVGIFSFLYILLLFIPFYVGYQTKSWVLSTIFAFIFASIGPSIFYRLQKKAVDLILARQRRYQGALLEMAKGMTGIHNLERLLRLIALLVKRRVGIKYTAIFYHDRENKVYPLKFMYGHRLKKKSSLAIKEEEKFIDYLRKKGEPFLYEETEEEMRKFLEEKLKTNFALLVPSVIHNELIGFLILGEKLDKSHYSIDDIETFKTLAFQAALAINHCLFLEEFKKAQERLFQAEKLAAIGGLADGITHQLKNRLNLFSVLCGEMSMITEEFRQKNTYVERDPKLKELLENYSRIARILLENVKKSDDVIKSILDFARVKEKDKYFDYFSIRGVINACVNLLLIKHEIEEFPLELKLNNVEIIWGIKTQLTEVIYNILDNAYEAIQQLYSLIPADKRNNHTPQIILEVKEFPQYWLISVYDNGIGIKEEDKKKILAPFFTTKSSHKSGSGIGMYIVRRIIEENHNGRIWFKSKYLKGTTFYIQLPKRGMKI
ncbi:MAG: hypothetical protein B6D56_02305 [Candidatus Omnitrophica bacterium 4484_70.1]|nr:MAG: hypothetical protein B6D56_02305 [Candidatus Omnitrophica bacterium 4484_70.1]